MTQDHLVIDFPIRGPANATALNEELPPLMADFARVQDDLGNVHFSRFMIKGDEKLLFLSDVDGEGTQHVERLVDSAGPVFEVIFDHVIDPPATPVADNREEVVKWLRDHVRAPLDMYFAYPDASVQDIKACAREAGFTGNTAQSPLLTYMPIKSRLQGVALKFDTRDIKDRGKDASDAIGTLHFSHWVPFDKDAIGFFTIFDGDFTKYIQDFTDKNLIRIRFGLSTCHGGAADTDTEERQRILSVGAGLQLSTNRVLQRLSRSLGSRRPSTAGRSQVAIHHHLNRTMKDRL